jgi:electron transport complex protein RnfG
MSTPPQKPVQPPSSFKMIRTLAGVALLSGFLIVLTVRATEARIDRNKRNALEQAVSQVLPGMETRQAFAVDGQQLTPIDNPGIGSDYIIAGYDGGGALVGIAVPASGMGYGGLIRALFGYDPEQQEIIGFTVLENKETPGLGDRIAKDPEFLSNFDGLQAELGPGGDALAHPIAYVKDGEKTEPWQIDGIAGATISSKAVAEMVDLRAEDVLPLIQQNLDQLRSRP